jgi:dihydroorotate dehydrogenase electron transfer subunit
MKKIKPQHCRVIQNKRLDRAGGYFALKVSGFKTARKIYPGSFVHIKVQNALDPFFRRAFSVADFDPESTSLEIIYKVVGKGTAILGHKKKDDQIDLIGPLGNRFSAIPKKKTVVIVAGGVGFPPLYFLARSLVDSGHDPQRISFFYGGQSKNDLVELNRIRRLGVELITCTDDGSIGFHGFVTAAVDERLDRLDPGNTVVCGCGPEPMLAALQDLAMRQGFTGEISLEAPMPCGVGVCLGCVKATVENPQKFVRVCYDGPVFKLGEVKI